jgi:hypothetical protein
MIKTIKVVINDDGTDKKFLITRMSAVATEKWALELFFALANAGVEIPDNLAEMGFAGIAQIGLQALGKIPFEKAEPLLNRMMDCVQFMPNDADDRVVRALLETDVEDPRTLLKLKKEVWSLHTDFLQAAKL